MTCQRQSWQWHFSGHTEDVNEEVKTLDTSDVIRTAYLPNTRLSRYSHIKVVNTNKFSKFILKGHAVAQFVEALCYKPEGRGFYSR
jgi:hypothetical protein